MKDCCHAVFTTPALSSAALERMNAVASVDWAQLWDLILKYKAPVIGIIESVLMALPIGAPWSDVIAAVLNEVAKL